MNRSGTEESIGFPAGQLAPEPLRLPLAHREPGFWVIAVPPRILSRPDPWYPGQPDLERAIESQLAEGKPELLRLGLVKPVRSVIGIDPEISGCRLLASGEAAIADYRNAVGSGQFRFVFRFFSRGRWPATGGEKLECTLPVARHRSEARVLVSHRTGKKSQTWFDCRRTHEGWLDLTAVTNLPRFHQIRLHAAECGFPVLNDTRYGGPACPSLGDLRRGVRGEAASSPLYRELALHLAAVEWDMEPAKTGSGKRTAEAAFPKGLLALERRLFPREGRVPFSDGATPDLPS